LVSFFIKSVTLIGISTIGPIAGGLFASMQGIGLVSGSFMALIQSFVMCGYALVAQIIAITFWIIIGATKLITQKK